MVDGGELSHFTGVPKQDIDAGVVPFTEVSQRHTKLNGWLTKLLSQEVTQEDDSIRRTSTAPSDSKPDTSKTAPGVGSAFPIDAHLLKLILNDET